MSEADWLDIFGDNLVGILREFRMTQNDLADAIGVSKSVVSSWINKQKMPSLKSIINMSHVLGVTVDELVYFDDKII